MFDTAYYLHYVLDTENDSHYTEDLMRLSSGSYLWRELKETRGFSRVVFVNLVKNQLLLETFDNASYQFLQPVKKNWLGFIVEQPVTEGLCHKTFPPVQIKQEESTLLHYLLECQQHHKKERTALVCTAEALEHLYSNAAPAHKSELVSCAENCALDAIMVVRLGMSTNSLAKTFLRGRCFLTELDKNIREVLRSHAQQPLLDMLSRQLGGQLVDFSRRQDDMVNLLMYDALENSSGTDSPDQLRHQGEYLQLCLDHQVGLAAYFTNSPRHEPLKKDTVFGKLADEEFRSRLRAETARLRARNPQSPMEDLFRREFRITADNKGIRDLCCEDELYRKVCSLTLPEDYLKQNLAHGRILEALAKALGTLWNKPRNPKVCEMIRFTSDMLLETAARKDWVTLSDVMTLLSLCSRQICADPVLNDNLDELFATGQELLLASADHSRQERSFRDMYPGGEPDYYAMSKSDLAIFLSTQTILENQGKKLRMLRSSLYDTILYFNDHPLSETVEQKLRESMRRWKEKLDQTQSDSELFSEGSSGHTWDNGSPYGDL